MPLDSLPPSTPAIREPIVPTLPKIRPYYTLDAWRGVAALWVVMVHACLPYILSGHRAFLHNPLYGVSVWGQFGVTMFFVISGYCITGAAYSSIAAGRPLRSFCLDRLRRIFPPYLAALLGAVLLAAVTNFLLSHHVLAGFHPSSLPPLKDVSFWLTNLTLTQVPAGQGSMIVVAWSLCYEIAFYAVIAGLLGLGRWPRCTGAPGRVLVLLAGVALLSIGSLAWLCVSPATCWFPCNLWYQFGLGALFFLSVALEESTPETFVRGLRAGGWLAGGAVLLLTAWYAVRGGRSDPAPLMLGHPSAHAQAVAALVFCGILHPLRRYDARLLRHKAVAALAHVGAFSYSLYLVHTLLLPYIDAPLRKAGLTEGWYLGTYLCQIAAAVGAGWLFFVGVERQFISKRQIARIAAE